MTSNLHGLAARGVSVWSDQISRSMLLDGDLSRLISEDAVTGVTSNPTIFAGAIGGSDAYDEQLADLRSAGLSTEDVVKHLMAEDIRMACDVLAPVHASSGGSDGFVSVEVSPTLAAETEATVSEARDWVKQIDRPNLLVKVPATKEGIPAVEQLIGEGISVNVTLIFSLQRYEEVIAAYKRGVEAYARLGGDVSRVASVASFFVSRFDTEVDSRLEEIGSVEARDLLGTTAVANARAAYGRYLHRFGSEFDDLRSAGARPQSPLWASTSTKNPDYDDLMYVDGLVAPGTVNTMPLGTIAAYRDHGNPEPTAFGDQEIEEANQTLRRLSDVGVDYQSVVDTLEVEGVNKFVDSWLQVLADVERA